MKISALGVSGRKIAEVKTEKPNNSAVSNNPIAKTSSENLLNFNNQINFARKWSEHTSWGAVVDPKTKDVSFKIFTWPDAKSVEVNVEKKDTNEVIAIDLKNKGNGIFETEKPVSSKLVQDGDSYFYKIEKTDGSIVEVKDPYSFKQEELMGKSVIYDHSKFQWHDKDWFSDNNPDRITNSNLNEAVIYEVNIASYTKSGDFEGLINKLPEIKANGFNTIEIMPVENTNSYNWGYDGVDKFAASQFLGGPNGLKELVDACHAIGISIVIDMVPNHHGPDGSQLGETGPYFNGNTGWGDAYRYEGENSQYVRDFMVNAALNWINNYHCDGIRYDMTKFMKSDHTMQQIRAEIAYHNPEVFTIAEDSREGINSDGENLWHDKTVKHDARVMQKLKPYDYAKGKDEETHAKAIEEIINNKTNIARLGYDSEWDFNFFHALKDCLYGNSNLDIFEDACLQSDGRVKYVMSHDEIGNYEGSRLIAKLIVPMFHLNENIILNDSDIKRANDYSKLKNCPFDEARQMIVFQKAQLTAEKLATLYVGGKLDKYSKNDEDGLFYNEVIKPLGIRQDANITPKRIELSYKKAFKTFKMGQTITYTQKGPKMVFQGDERASMVPFRFFRQFSDGAREDYLYTEKGYEPGLSAFKESKIDSLKLSTNGERYEQGFNNLIRDLNKLNKENKAIVNGRIVTQDTVKHSGSQVIALHMADDETKNHIYTITNFSDLKYPREEADRYYISFPKGKWVEILNTDDTRYMGTGMVNKEQIIESDGHTGYPINLASKSTLIFKKLD